MSHTRTQRPSGRGRHPPGAVFEMGGESVLRFDEALRYVPLERLALSPQCGFGSAFPGNRLSEAEQRAKLELVSQVARQVWH